MTDLQIANMLADYHKECEAAETLREKADIQLKHARLIREALRQPLVSGELNCEHDWLVDMYDHFGFPASRFCDKCSTREAI